MKQQPSVDEFIRNWYTPEGDQVTGQTLELLEAKLLPALSTKLADGTPQITTPAQDHTSKGCQDQVNQLAVNSPSWAKSVGHTGLFKVLTACVSESNGNAPSGFTQQVASALKAPWYKRPTTWAIVVGLGAGAYYWMRKR